MTDARERPRAWFVLGQARHPLQYARAHGMLLYRNVHWPTISQIFLFRHTISAFAFGISVSGFYPLLLGALLFCAFSVATSRIVLGMQFVSDVVVGALVGAGLGYASFLIFA
jgi:hypothetical protein